MVNGAGGPVALYVHALAPTGVVKNSLAIAAALRADGQRVELVTALPGGTPPDGVAHVALLPGPFRRRWIEHGAAVPALRRYLAERRPGIAISMGNHGHATMWAATLGLADVRRVFRISNDLSRDAPGAPRGGWVKRFARRRLAARLVRSADRLVLVSPSLLADPLLATARAVVIANGVDVDEARARAGAPSPHLWLGGAEPVAVAVGRLAAQKNFGTLLEAVAMVRKERPLRLVILGESRDSARSELAARAAALGIGEAVLLPGTTDNVFAWVARADVFVLPSWWEGSANVLLEAMAVGTPVVASRSAGNAAQVVGDAHGLLCDPADAEAMAGAISRQLEPRTRVGPGDRAADFALSATTAAWCALVRELGSPAR